MWKLKAVYEDENSDYKCDRARRRIEASSIVYGETPACYYEETSAKKLELGKEYGLFYSRVRDSGEGVRFILVDCKKNKGILCLDTRSNRRMYEIEERREDYTLVGCENSADGICIVTNSPATEEIKRRHKKLVELIADKRLFSEYYVDIKKTS